MLSVSKYLVSVPCDFPLMILVSAKWFVKYFIFCKLLLMLHMKY